MDMVIVFRDIDTGKITLYNSGSQDCARNLFTLEDAKNAIDQWKAKKRKIHFFDDSDYAKLRLTKSTNINVDDDDEMDDVDEDDHHLEKILGKRNLEESSAILQSSGHLNDDQEPFKKTDSLIQSNLTRFKRFDKVA